MLGILRTGIRTELLYYRVEIKRGHEGPMIQQPAKEHTNLSSTAAAFRIAVLIPTFNHAKTLEKVVRGAFESTLPVIVIDDASTDDSPAIISKLHEEGLVLALFDEGERTLGHELGKVLAGSLHRLGSFIKVVKARTVKKEVVVVVDEPIPDSEELVEALFLRPVVTMGSEVPLAKNRCFVPFCFT